MIVCLAANPSIDRLFEVSELRIGEIHRPEQLTQVAGGKGLNAARAAATMGADVRVVAIVGGHAGRWLADELEREGVPAELVWVESESRSSLSVADQTDDSLLEFYERGHEIGRADWAAFAAAAARLSRTADWLTISGSTPPGAPPSGYRDLDIACSLAIDTVAPAPERFDLVKVNAGEAESLTGIDTGQPDGPLAAAAALGAGLATAVVTTGAMGATMVTADGQAYQGKLDERGRYPVGSGDSFLGGLVAGRAVGASWEEALALAMGAAAANAAVPGAARFERQAAERLAGLAAVIQL